MIGKAPDGRAECLECTPVRTFKALSGHIQIHAMSLDEYRLRHSIDGSGEDVFVGWTVKDAPGFNKKMEERQADAAKVANAYNPTEGIFATFSKSETEEYHRRFKILFEQADRDPALESAIRDIVLGDINIARYQEQISKITQKFATGKAVDILDAQKLGVFSDLVKKTQDTNLRAMNALNLTREKKQKTKTTIETTPSRMVAAYYKFRESLSPDQLASQNQDEQDALIRLHAKRAEFDALVVVEASENE